MFQIYTLRRYTTALRDSPGRDASGPPLPPLPSLCTRDQVCHVPCGPCFLLPPPPPPLPPSCMACTYVCPSHPLPTATARHPLVAPSCITNMMLLRCATRHETSGAPVDVSPRFQQSDDADRSPCASSFYCTPGRIAHSHAITCVHGFHAALTLRNRSAPLSPSDARKRSIACARFHPAPTGPSRRFPGLAKLSASRHLDLAAAMMR